MNWLGCYVRVIDHLAVKNVAQGAPLVGGSTLMWLLTRDDFTEFWHCKTFKRHIK
jgi:hypothetical protein